jgi:hypothetical protein
MAENKQLVVYAAAYETVEAARKYSEIVWLPMSRIASTSTNADRLTGLPNTYDLHEADANDDLRQPIGDLLQISVALVLCSPFRWS